MLILLKDIQDKQKKVDPPDNKFDLYIYNYIIESLDLLIDQIKKERELHEKMEFEQHSLEISRKMLENQGINSLEDMITVIGVLDETFKDMKEIFPHFCKAMRSKLGSGENTEDGLKHLAFESAFAHNRIKCIYSDIKVMLKYKQNTKL